ncbi:hypothetical protein [Streptomyces sp. BPTC-684]|uniref:hypothetical protein n=1 Tax=Streptomyces sp. BPTC-684 TaxID=3043734 RepID=UPI0024B04B55|nr:hypothetical protein [Streptomyces sp. BPTC-684]WHM40998.1 hypothetical protein QIY60_31785 [Streptomyces sp. BPTC-684]
MTFTMGGWSGHGMETSTTSDRVPAGAVTLLEALLTGDDPVHRALRAQIPHLRVTGHCTCSCASVDLGLDETLAAAAHVADDPVVAEAEVLDADGQPIGGVLVFAHAGYLSYLETYTWLDEQITQFPAPDRIG